LSLGFWDGLCPLLRCFEELEDIEELFYSLELNFEDVLSGQSLFPFGFSTSEDFLCERSKVFDPWKIPLGCPPKFGLIH
jgi:hypothetical protein